MDYCCFLLARHIITCRGVGGAVYDTTLRKLVLEDDGVYIVLLLPNFHHNSRREICESVLHVRLTLGLSKLIALMFLSVR